MSNLVLRNVNKVYPNGFAAVHDFNLEIKNGEFIVFVGPSGCGKSTTLRMIAGLEEITSGDFLIEDKRVNDMSPRQRGISMIFQSYALYPNMSVYENMAFGLQLKGYDGEAIEKRVRKTAKILGLTDYLDRMPRELSGGQRQRVAVGRAIIRKVDIFLMDEPLSNLDAKQRVTMRSEITAIHRKIGATTIYVTHDQTEAMTMADRIVVMKDGRIQQVGTPKELYFDPVNLFVAGFIGEPPMNFMKGTISAGGFVAEGSSKELKLGPAYDEFVNQNSGKKVILGFRPEAVERASETTRTDGIRLDTEVSLTELLGDNTNVYAAYEGIDLIFKLDPHLTPERHTKCEVFVPFESVYLFDQETEERIK
ncbi:MAG: sn-glycerol-3-phosphate ABC transporter ATP-binding protein UgpC [Lachnospiraceae bacterium]|nr:sn-glycerol-3-phosphate ABC transporter ATP-binding protein UgpC [Lachnospiraceae bacterium]